MAEKKIIEMNAVAKEETTKETKKKKSIQVTFTMFTQQMSHLRDENPEIYADGTQAGIAQAVYDRLTDAGYEISYLAALIHNQDTLQVYDEERDVETFEHKPDHIHMIIHFTGRTQFNDKLAGAINEELQFFEKPSKGRYAEENMLAYLTHSKQPEKHFYEEEIDQVTVIGKLPTASAQDGSYRRYFNEHHDSWMKNRATRKIQQHKVGIDELVQKIFDFEVTKEEVMNDKNYTLTYLANSSMIDKAFEIRMYRKFNQLNKDFDNGNFDVTVVYIDGSSGQGKTTLARSLYMDLQGVGQTVYTASAVNPFDSYRGEDILILDDVKAKTLRPEEWLRIMDPQMFGELGSRYKNKDRGFKTVIITGIQSPDVFFDSLTNRVNISDEYGPVIQFLRRLTFVVTAVDLQYIIERLTFLSSIGDVTNIPMLGGGPASLSDATKFLSDEIKDRTDPNKPHDHKYENPFNIMDSAGSEIPDMVKFIKDKPDMVTRKALIKSLWKFINENNIDDFDTFEDFVGSVFEEYESQENEQVSEWKGQKI